MLGTSFANGWALPSAAETHRCLCCTSKPGAKEHLRCYRPGEISQVCLLLRVPCLLLVLAQSASDRMARFQVLVLFFDASHRSAHAVAIWEYAARQLAESQIPV